MPLTDEQKTDLQFWFYNRIYVNKESPAAALDRAARESASDRAEAEAYLLQDGRISGAGKDIALVSYPKDSADPKGVYIDIEWMTHILRDQASLKADALHQALSTIFKISPATAASEAAQIPEVQGE